MEKKTIYKRDSDNRPRFLSLWVEGNPDDPTASATIQNESGILNEDGSLAGKVKRELPIVITEGKNLGKKNATTPYTQAVAEVEAKLRLKLRKDYRENLTDAQSNVLSTGMGEPMTAKKYDPLGKQLGSKTLGKFKMQDEDVHVQPKIDGNRNMSALDVDSVNFFTRSGKTFPHIPHIEDQLQQAFNASGLDPMTIDGELHSDEYPFRVFNGILNKKTEHLTDEDRKIIATLNYWIYDVYSDEGYEKRYETLKTLLSTDVATPNLILIPSKKIKATDEALLKELEEYLEKGYEGAMIRRLGKGYEHKRTDQLIKYKVFEDAEFKILDLYPNTQGNLGGFTVELDIPVVDRDGKTLTTVDVGTTGIKHSEGREMLENKEQYIGKMATIEFFGRDPRPRFPKFKAVRN